MDKALERSAAWPFVLQADCVQCCTDDWLTWVRSNFTASEHTQRRLCDALMNIHSLVRKSYLSMYVACHPILAGLLKVSCNLQRKSPIQTYHGSHLAKELSPNVIELLLTDNDSSIHIVRRGCKELNGLVTIILIQATIILWCLFNSIFTVCLANMEALVRVANFVCYRSFENFFTWLSLHFVLGYIEVSILVNDCLLLVVVLLFFTDHCLPYSHLLSYQPLKQLSFLLWISVIWSLDWI